MNLQIFLANKIHYSFAPCQSDSFAPELQPKLAAALYCIHFAIMTKNKIVQSYFQTTQNLWCYEWMVYVLQLLSSIVEII